MQKLTFLFCFMLFDSFCLPPCTLYLFIYIVTSSFLSCLVPRFIYFLFHLIFVLSWFHYISMRSPFAFLNLFASSSSPLFIFSSISNLELGDELHDREVVVQFPVRVKYSYFLFSRRSTQALEPTQAHILGGPFPEVKRWRTRRQLLPSSAKVKNVRFLPPIVRILSWLMLN